MIAESSTISLVERYGSFGLVVAVMIFIGWTIRGSLPRVLDLWVRLTEAVERIDKDVTTLSASHTEHDRRMSDAADKLKETLAQKGYCPARDNPMVAQKIREMTEKEK